MCADTPSIESAWTRRVATALYTGVVSAGIVTIAVASAGRSAAIALPTLSPTALAGVFAIALLVGACFGLLVSRRETLTNRLGRSATHRVGLQVPALAFGLLAVGAWSGPIAAPIGTVAFVLTVAAGVLGGAVGSIAKTQYAVSQIGDEPSTTVAWTPPGSPRLEVLLALLWIGMGVANAAGGNSRMALFWATLGLLFVGARIIEGGWPIGVGSAPEIRIYEVGIVRQRPFTSEFVPWESVDRVRLREGELVIDRGLFDIRFDNEELGDAPQALAAIERQLDTAASRSEQ